MGVKLEVAHSLVVDDLQLEEGWRPEVQVKAEAEGLLKVQEASEVGGLREQGWAGSKQVEGDWVVGSLLVED